jgi:hypothetical protein
MNMNFHQVRPAMRNVRIWQPETSPGFYPEKGNTQGNNDLRAHTGEQKLESKRVFESVKDESKNTGDDRGTGARAADTNDASSDLL